MTGLVDKSVNLFHLAWYIGLLDAYSFLGQNYLRATGHNQGLDKTAMIYLLLHNYMLKYYFNSLIFFTNWENVSATFGAVLVLRKQVFHTMSDPTRLASEYPRSFLHRWGFQKSSVCNFCDVMLGSQHYLIFLVLFDVDMNSFISFYEIFQILLIFRRPSWNRLQIRWF